jgi:AraC-like DNA-binding protein
MQNPFEQQLSAYRPGPLTGPAIEAPLPLWEGSKPSPGEETRIFECEVGDLTIIAASGSGRRRALMARPWISVIYVVWGEILIAQSGRQVCAKASGCVLIPQSPAMWQSEAFSVVCIMLRPQRMAALMHIDVPGADRVQGSRSACLAAYDVSRERGRLDHALLDLLAVNLRVVAALQSDDRQLIKRLALADQLARVIAAMASMTPADENLQDPQQRFSPAGMQDTLDDLIAFIQANLDQPLNLAVLEHRTHYSRRALQYAFRKRLGCTASQWIRSQRLDLAYQYLQHAEATDSVSSIALRCGYRSVSLFSIDFQQRFHIKPSHLLRHSRQPS